MQLEKKIRIRARLQACRKRPAEIPPSAAAPVGEAVSPLARFGGIAEAKP